MTGTITNTTTYSFGVSPDLSGYSGTLPALSPGVTVTGISTDGVTFTPVTTTDPSFATSASVTGAYITLNVNRDGTAQDVPTPNAQTLINDIEANHTAATPLSDTFYYQLSNGDVDELTYTLNDVIFTADGSAYGTLAPLIVAPDTTTNISGLAVDTALSSTEDTDQNTVVTLTVSLYDFSTGKSDGALSLDPLQEAAGAGGTITTVSTGENHSITVIGSIAQINADLAGLSYVASATADDNIIVQATDGPATTASFIEGSVKTGAPVAVTNAFQFQLAVGPESSNVIDSGFGITITGISTNGVDFTPVDANDPTFARSAEVDGEYTTFSANENGTVQFGLVQEVQPVINDIQANQNDGATTPVADTYYFEYDNAGATGVDIITVALNDVEFIQSAAPFGSALTIALGTSIDIPGLAVDKALATGQTTDQNEPLTLVLSTKDFTTGTGDGTLSIDPSAVGTIAGATITEGADTLTISGSIAQINSALQGLAYTDATPGPDTILAQAFDGPAQTGQDEIGQVDVPLPVNNTHAFSYDFPNSNGYSTTLPGLGAGETLTGISTDDVNFTPVTLTDPTYAASASVTGQYLTFNANADGTGQEVPYPDAQTVIDELANAASSDTSLADTFFYQYTSAGSSFVDQITWSLEDVELTTSGPAYGPAGVGIGLNTAINIGGITVDQPLATGQTTDAGDMLTFTVGIYDFTTGDADGALSVNPAQEGAGAGGIVTPGTVSLGATGTSVSTETFTGAISQIDADLQGLTYTSSNTAGTDTLYWTANNNPLAYEGATLGSIHSPCYCHGTRILTDHGEVAVEDLRIGDRLVTRTGAARALRWIGRRSYSPRFAAANPDVLPVRICAGAIAEGVPARDLYVSPLHAMYLDDVLIPAAALVNGVSIRRVGATAAVEYVHLELDTHDVIFAEGAEAETYLDDNNRNMFHNAASHAALYPDAPRTAPRYCAPRLDGGAAVERVRAHLAARCGATAPRTHNVMLETAGLTGVRVPPDVTELHLQSPVGNTDSDRRALGALVLGIRVDGVALALSDVRLARGFHPTERHGVAAVRWTNGAAVITLPPGETDRLVEVDIGAVMPIRDAA